MDFIKYKYTIAIASIIILIMVSVHGSLKLFMINHINLKNPNTYDPKHLAAIDKKSGFTCFYSEDYHATMIGFYLGML